MLPNLSRFSRQYQIAQRTGGMAIPPATKIRLRPSHCSVGYQLPYGPRKPIVSPSSSFQNESVTRPTRLKQNSRRSFQVELPQILKVDSPEPKRDQMPN